MSRLRAVSSAMPNTLRRLISLLLIPGLLIEPATASVLSCPPATSRVSLMTRMDAARLDQEALAALAVPFTHGIASGQHMRQWVEGWRQANRTRAASRVAAQTLLASSNQDLPNADRLLGASVLIVLLAMVLPLVWPHLSDFSGSSLTHPAALWVSGLAERWNPEALWAAAPTALGIAGVIAAVFLPPKDEAAARAEAKELQFLYDISGDIKSLAEHGIPPATMELLFKARKAADEGYPNPFRSFHDLNQYFLLEFPDTASPLTIGLLETFREAGQPKAGVLTPPAVMKRPGKPLTADQPKQREARRLELAALFGAMEEMGISIPYLGAIAGLKKLSDRKDTITEEQLDRLRRIVEVISRNQKGIRAYLARKHQVALASAVAARKTHRASRDDQKAKLKELVTSANRGAYIVPDYILNAFMQDPRTHEWREFWSWLLKHREDSNTHALLLDGLFTPEGNTNRAFTVKLLRSIPGPQPRAIQALSLPISNNREVVVLQPGDKIIIKLSPSSNRGLSNAVLLLGASVLIVLLAMVLPLVWPHLSDFSGSSLTHPAALWVSGLAERWNPEALWAAAPTALGIAGVIAAVFLPPKDEAAARAEAKELQFLYDISGDIQSLINYGIPLATRETLLSARRAADAGGANPFQSFEDLKQYFSMESPAMGGLLIKRLRIRLSTKERPHGDPKSRVLTPPAVKEGRGHRLTADEKQQREARRSKLLELLKAMRNMKIPIRYLEEQSGIGDLSERLRDKDISPKDLAHLRRVIQGISRKQKKIRADLARKRRAALAIAGAAQTSLAASRNKRRAEFKKRVKSADQGASIVPDKLLREFMKGDQPLRWREFWPWLHDHREVSETHALLLDGLFKLQGNVNPSFVVYLQRPSPGAAPHSDNGQMIPVRDQTVLRKGDQLVIQLKKPPSKPASPKGKEEPTTAPTPRTPTQGQHSLLGDGFTEAQQEGFGKRQINLGRVATRTQLSDAARLIDQWIDQQDFTTQILFEQLPELIDPLRRLADLLRSDPSELLIDGKRYQFEVLVFPSDLLFEENETRVEAFCWKSEPDAPSETGTIRLFIHDNGLAGLIHEGLEHLVLPQMTDIPVGQHHLLALYGESLASAVAVRLPDSNRVAILPERLFREIEKMTPDGKKVLFEGTDDADARNVNRFWPSDDRASRLLSFSRRVTLAVERVSSGSFELVHAPSFLTDLLEQNRLILGLESGPQGAAVPVRRSMHSQDVDHIPKDLALRAAGAGYLGMGPHKRLYWAKGICLARLGAPTRQAPPGENVDPVMVHFGNNIRIDTRGFRFRLYQRGGRLWFVEGTSPVKVEFDQVVSIGSSGADDNVDGDRDLPSMHFQFKVSKVPEGGFRITFTQLPPDGIDVEWDTLPEAGQGSWTSTTFSALPLLLLNSFLMKNFASFLYRSVEAAHPASLGSYGERIDLLGGSILLQAGPGPILISAISAVAMYGLFRFLRRPQASASGALPHPGLLQAA